MKVRNLLAVVVVISMLSGMLPEVYVNAAGHVHTADCYVGHRHTGSCVSPVTGSDQLYIFRMDNAANNGVAYYVMCGKDRASSGWTGHEVFSIRKIPDGTFFLDSNGLFNNSNASYKNGTYLANYDSTYFNTLSITPEQLYNEIEALVVTYGAKYYTNGNSLSTVWDNTKGSFTFKELPNGFKLKSLGACRSCNTCPGPINYGTAVLMGPGYFGGGSNLYSRAGVCSSCGRTFTLYINDNPNSADTLCDSTRLFSEEGYVIDEKFNAGANADYVRTTVGYNNWYCPFVKKNVCAETEDPTPICNSVIVSMNPPVMVFKAQYGQACTTSGVLNYLDGSSQNLSLTNTFNSSIVGEQTGTIGLTGIRLGYAKNEQASILVPAKAVIYKLCPVCGSRHISANCLVCSSNTIQSRVSSISRYSTRLATIKSNEVITKQSVITMQNSNLY